MDFNITQEDFKWLCAIKRPLIIDIRSPEEIAVNGTIQGSINIPRESIKFYFEILLPK